MAATKPGYKTSEFWLAFLAMLLTMFYASGIVVPPRVEGIIGFVAATLTAAGYAVSRGGVKKALGESDAKSGDNG